MTLRKAFAVLGALQVLVVIATPARQQIPPTVRSRKGGVAAFGKVRLVTLIEVGTHADIDAAFGTESEQALASRLAPALTTGMLLLGDRDFPSWRLWTHCADTGAHLLWRVEASRPVPRLARSRTGPGWPSCQYSTTKVRQHPLATMNTQLKPLSPDTGHRDRAKVP